MKEKNNEGRPLPEAGGRRAGSLSDDDIYLDLYGSIIGRLIPPGMKLPEDTLAEVYKVGRARIRRILARLQAENIVVLRQNRGASVACPTVKDARDIFAVRRVLEPMTAATAARTASAAQIEDLRRLVSEERSFIARGDRRTQLALSSEFHMKLAEITNNQTLERFIRELISRSALVATLHEFDLAPGCNIGEHEALVELIATHEEEAAAAHMERHLHHVEESLDLESSRNRKIDLHEVLGKFR